MGALRITNSLVNNNTGYGILEELDDLSGGVVLYNKGHGSASLYIGDSVVADNNFNFSGFTGSQGGVVGASSSKAGAGPAVNIEIDNTTISGNYGQPGAINSFAGGGLVVDNGSAGLFTVKVTQSAIVNNIEDVAGPVYTGGVVIINNRGGVTVDISNSTVSGNKSGNGNASGGIVIVNLQNGVGPLIVRY